MHIYKTTRLSDYKFILAYVIIITTSLSSCKKFIEVDAPNTSINQGNVYNDNSNAISVITGVYTKMASSTLSLDISVYTDLAADNLSLYDVNNIYAKSYYQNALSSTYINATSIPWIDLYSYIYVTNVAIEGLSNSVVLSAMIKQRLLGEAYFLRGFYYYYLVSLYGNVPLILSSDYSKNATVGNSPKESVYEQVVTDLKMAQSLLDDNYYDGTLLKETTERLRPNKSAATAMLSRVYLYLKNYAAAESEATKIISKVETYSLPEVEATFLKNSTETIWALQPVRLNTNTVEGDFFIYSSDGPNTTNYTSLSDSFMSSFEIGDKRKQLWTNNIVKDNKTYYYPYKYKIKNGSSASPVEYTIILRVGEQYLIRSEARIQQGKISDGINDLNQIRSRARENPTTTVPNPLPELPTSLSKNLAIKALLQERRVELFTEWGSRWFDLKRLNAIDDVMKSITPIKGGGEWKDYYNLFPVPLVEIQHNRNLIQNPGYN